MRLGLGWLHGLWSFLNQAFILDSIIVEPIVAVLKVLPRLLVVDQDDQQTSQNACSCADACRNESCVKLELRRKGQSCALDGHAIGRSEVDSLPARSKGSSNNALEPKERPRDCRNDHSLSGSWFLHQILDERLYDASTCSGHKSIGRDRDVKRRSTNDDSTSNWSVKRIAKDQSTVDQQGNEHCADEA